MIVLGIVAILQILILPGWIFVILYRHDGGGFFRFSSIVAASLLANAVLVYLLAHLGLYNRTVILLLLALEVLTLGFLTRRDWAEPLETRLARLWANGRTVLQGIPATLTRGELSLTANSIRAGGILALYLLAGSILYWFLGRIIGNIGTVPNTWDAVVSWNHWAQQWATGKPAEPFFTYPQLLPLNLSLTYVLIGNTQVNLFAKAIMPLFAFLTAAMLFQLTLERKQPGYLIGVILVYLLYKKFLGATFADAYADAPAAFMGLAALLPFVRKSEPGDQPRDLLFACLLAAGAAITKQTGLLTLYLLLAGAMLVPGGLRREHLWATFRSALPAVVILAAFYLPTAIRIQQDPSVTGLANYAAISDQALGASSLPVRIVSALEGLGRYLILFLLLIPAYVGGERRLRQLILLGILPFTLLWAAIASYDQRNLAIIFPLLALAAGSGAQYLGDWLLAAFDRLKPSRLPLLILPLLAVLGLAILALLLPPAKVEQAWEERQKQIFSPEINAQLYQLDWSDPGCRVVTNYPVDFLPGLAGRQIVFTFQDVQVFQTLVRQAEVCWILEPNYAQGEITAAIDEQLAAGNYALVFATREWIPYRLVRVR